MLITAVVYSYPRYDCVNTGVVKPLQASIWSVTCSRGEAAQRRRGCRAVGTARSLPYFDRMSSGGVGERGGSHRSMNGWFSRSPSRT
jgi:hypothetical protein